MTRLTRRLDRKRLTIVGLAAIAVAALGVWAHAQNLAADGWGGFLGFLGAGTKSPAARLHVYEAGATDATALIEASQTNQAAAVQLKNTAGSSTVYRDGAGNLKLRQGANDIVTVQPAGNVGIGTAAPGYALDVNGGARASDGVKVPYYTRLLGAQYTNGVLGSWIQVPGWTVSVTVAVPSNLEIDLSASMFGKTAGGNPSYLCIGVDGAYCYGTAGVASGHWQNISGKAYVPVAAGTHTIQVFANAGQTQYLYANSGLYTKVYPQ
jgi:hypothetical protein